MKYGRITMRLYKSLLYKIRVKGNEAVNVVWHNDECVFYDSWT